MTEQKGTSDRTASCGCGNLTVTALGEPLQVYACSCLNCQRESGGAFTYSAVYPEAAVSIAGERRAWRRHGESKRWIETEFCPTCGTTVLCRIEAWPEVIAISVGCFADPNFAEPETLYWASRQHRWLAFPEGTQTMTSQPD